MKRLHGKCSNPKIAICDCCGQKWNVSRTKDISKVYVCPQCEKKLDGRGGKA